jgi:sirohydrochlorin ferrochelatase
VLEDIPTAVEALRRDHPGVEILLAPHLGTHPKLAEIAAERLQEVLA